MSPANRVLGVDFGTVRVGLAVSDPDRKIGFPFKTYTRRAPESDADFLVEIVTDRRGFEFFGLLEDLRRDLEAFLGRPVNVGEAVQAHARENVERDVVPL